MPYLDDTAYIFTENLSSFYVTISSTEFFILQYWTTICSVIGINAKQLFDVINTPTSYVQFVSTVSNVDNNCTVFLLCHSPMLYAGGIDSGMFVDTDELDVLFQNAG